jgi:hypothetical protein
MLEAGYPGPFHVSGVPLASEIVFLSASMQEPFRSKLLSQTGKVRHLKPGWYLDRTRDSCILQLRGVSW